MPSALISKIKKTFGLKSLVLLGTLFVLSGCGQNSESPDFTNQQGDQVQFQLPDSLLGNKVDRNNLSAKIFYGSSSQDMDINDADDSANVTLSNVPTGNVTFIIEFTYDFGGTPLVVARAEQSFDVVEGSNSFSFTEPYDTSMDEDNDGLTNIVELQESSNTSPTVSLCQLGSGEIGSCELGS